MYRGTTPTLTFKVNTNLDLLSLSDLALTIQSSSYTKTWHKSDVQIDRDEKTISLTMTQAESLKFSAGVASFQILFKTQSGKILPTPVYKNIRIEDVLKGGVL